MRYRLRVALPLATLAATAAGSTSWPGPAFAAELGQRRSSFTPATRATTQDCPLLRQRLIAEHVRGVRDRLLSRHFDAVAQPGCRLGRLVSRSARGTCLPFPARPGSRSFATSFRNPALAALVPPPRLAARALSAVASPAAIGSGETVPVFSSVARSTSGRPAPELSARAPILGPPLPDPSCCHLAVRCRPRAPPACAGSSGYQSAASSSTRSLLAEPASLDRAQHLDASVELVGDDQRGALVQPRALLLRALGLGRATLAFDGGEAARSTLPLPALPWR